MTFYLFMAFCQHADKQSVGRLSFADGAKGLMPVVYRATPAGAPGTPPLGIPPPRCGGKKNQSFFSPISSSRKIRASISFTLPSGWRAICGSKSI